LYLLIKFFGVVEAISGRGIWQKNIAVIIVFGSFQHTAWRFVAEK